MSIYRCKQDLDYTMIPTEMLHDKNLSIEAKGFMISVYALYQKGKSITKENTFNKNDSKKTNEKAWNELIKSGYIEQEKERSNENGK